MGTKTRARLISEALELAGNTSLVPRAKQWLDTIMVELWASAPWHFARKRYTLSLPAGTSSIAIGEPASTPDEDMVRSIDSIVPVVNGKARDPLITSIQGDGDIDHDPDLMVRSAGIPEAATLQNYGDPYAWNIRLDRPTDRTITFVIDVFLVPRGLENDNDIPRYPNDETIIQALIVKAVKHSPVEGMDWRSEQAVLDRMKAEDRVIYLKSSIQSPNIGLSSRFSSQRARKSWLHE